MKECKITDAGIFWEEAGVRLAELVFAQEAEGLVITRIFVSETLRGQGVAGQLMEEAVAYLRTQGSQARTGCSYAAQWLQKHPEAGDVLRS